jgi:hypothetical protein
MFGLIVKKICYWLHGGRMTAEKRQERRAPLRARISPEQSAMEIIFPEA